MFEHAIRSVPEIPEAWFLSAGVLVGVLTTVFFSVVMVRLSRKLKLVDALVFELQAEVDRLRQAEERRALADLKSNRVFLQNLALELTDISSAAHQDDHSSESLGPPNDPVRFKMSSTG